MPMIIEGTYVVRCDKCGTWLCNGTAFTDPLAAQQVARLLGWTCETIGKALCRECNAESAARTRPDAHGLAGAEGLLRAALEKIAYEPLGRTVGDSMEQAVDLARRALEAARNVEARPKADPKTKPT